MRTDILRQPVCYSSFNIPKGGNHMGSMTAYLFIDTYYSLFVPYI